MSFKTLTDLYIPGIYYGLCYIFPWSWRQIRKLSTKFWPYEFVSICSFVRRRATACLDSLDKPDNFLFSVSNAKFRAEKYGQTLVQMITHTYSPSSLTEEFFFYKKNENSSCHFISQFNAISFIKKKSSSVLISDHNWIKFFSQKIWYPIM